MGPVTQIPSYAVSHPAVLFTSLAAFQAFFALTPTPNIISIAALVVVLRLSAWTFVPRPGGYAKGILQALVISLAAGAAHMAPSIDALSTPNLALVIFSGISLLASSFSVLIVFASVWLARFFRSPWTQLTLFPALWASAWGFMSEVSPVGQLVTWSPVLGLGPYNWVRPALGQWGIDWITAAWAVVVSELAGDYITSATTSLPPLVDVEDPSGSNADDSPLDSLARPSGSPHWLSRSRSLQVLVAMLLGLMIPTYFLSYLPAPLHAEGTTRLGVACALPDLATGKNPGRLPTLEDFVQETKKLQTHATVIFWPESAVHFNSPEQRETAFAEIQQVMNYQKYVGVSFEEFVPPVRKGASGHRRNAFALIGKTGPPALEYDKRNLVPIAESFSLTPGRAAPDIFTVPLPPPKGVKRSEWAPGPNYTRPIPLTASICLDFATASSFTSLPSRPALILAPAKTWHIAVGLAMWEQARARAAETGSTVAWCDGGKGGISGIASGGYSEIVQVGPGSWAKDLPVDYPFDERRTFYTWGGDFVALIAVWTVMGVGTGFQIAQRAIAIRRLGLLGFVQRILTRGPSRAQLTGPTEETSLLG